MVKDNNRLTFGDHLRQVALSIDFIDKDKLKDLNELIAEYLTKHLHASQIAFFEEETRDLDLEKSHDPADRFLRHVWSVPLWETAGIAMRKKDGCWNRQLALAAGERRNLWIVSNTGQSLGENNPGVDIWGDVDTNMPPFFKASEEAQTAIVLTGGKQGIFLVELEQRVEKTELLKDEMVSLANAVDTLHKTMAFAKQQDHETREAIRNLRGVLNASKLSLEPKPLMFIASAQQAKDDVMDVIREVLNSHSGKVTLRYWSELHDLGNVNDQIVHEILRASYGICYLSEPDPIEPMKYVDNPNVLMEAGMLNMTTGIPGSGSGWIPIRECNSPMIPFDLRAQRVILVRRNSSGKLDKSSLRRDLENKLKSLLT